VGVPGCRGSNPLAGRNVYRGGVRAGKLSYSPATMSESPLTLRRVAEIVGGTVEGDGERRVQALAGLDEAGPDDLTFADARHVAALAASGAAAAIVPPDRPKSAGIPLVRVEDVSLAVFRLLKHLAGPDGDLPPAGVHPSALVSADATIGQGVAVGPGVVVREGAKVGDRAVLCAGAFVGRDVQIGADTVLHEGAVVRAAARVGRRVRVGPNSVVGFEGFGYQTIDGVHHHVPHLGSVAIDDDVEIGACACVDRAKFPGTTTRIEAGAKLDNLVQVAHNCRVGAGSILVAQAGLAGSVRLGRYVVLGGSAGVRDNVTMGDGAQLAAYSGLSEDVPAGGRVAGTPAMPVPEAFRVFQAWRRLPGLLKRVRELESRLEKLESSEDH